MIMASKLRKSFLLIGIIVMGSFVANAMGIHLIPPTTTVHGKPTVKLSKKFSLDFPYATIAVSWSPDGSTLGVYSNFTKLSTFDASGHPLNEFEGNGNKGGVENSAFIAGSSQVLFPVESAAKIDAALDIRDVATGRIVKTIDNKSFIPGSFAVSLDQKRVAIAGGLAKEVIIYDTKDWHQLSTVNEFMIEKKQWLANISLCFFPDGKLLAVGQSDGHFAVVDSTSGKTIKEFHAYDAPGVDDNVAGLAVSPKGDLLLTGLSGVGVTNLATPEALAWNRSDHAVVSIWRISDGKEIAHLPNKNKATRQAVWDPLNRFVAFVDNDSLVVWQPEIPGENFIRIKYPSLASSLAITHDGKSLAVAAGNNVTVYNIE
jgi:WD40 repeat protein